MALLALVNMMVSVIARGIAWRFQFPAVILLALTGLPAAPLDSSGYRLGRVK